MESYCANIPRHQPDEFPTKRGKRGFGPASVATNVCFRTHFDLELLPRAFGVGCSRSSEPVQVVAGFSSFDCCGGTIGLVTPLNTASIAGTDGVVLG